MSAGPLLRPEWIVEGERQVTLRDGCLARLRPLTPPAAPHPPAFFAVLGEREAYYFFTRDETEACKMALEVPEAPAWRLVAVDEARRPPVALGDPQLEHRRLIVGAHAQQRGRLPLDQPGHRLGIERIALVRCDTQRPSWPRSLLLQCGETLLKLLHRGREGMLEVDIAQARQDQD